LNKFIKSILSAVFFSPFLLFSQSTNSGQSQFEIYNGFTLDIANVIDTQQYSITQNDIGVEITSKKDSLVYRVYLVSDEVVNVKKRHSQTVENELFNYAFKTYYDNSVQDTSGVFCYSLLNIKKNSMLVNIVPCQFDTIELNFVYNVLLGLIRFDKVNKIVVISSFQIVKKKEEINESLIRQFEIYFNNLKLN
jgi:hypothetical protein